MFNIFRLNSYPRVNELKNKLKSIPNIEYNSYETYLKEFNIYELYKMEEFFAGPTWYKGMILFYENKVINYKKVNNIHFCNVINNGNKYNVMATIDSSNKIVDSSCTCKYHDKYGKDRLCKHVGALVTKIYHRVDIELLRKELLKKLEVIKDVLNDVDYIINNESKYFKKDVLKQLKKDYERLSSSYKNELGHVNGYDTETSMVLNVRSIDIFTNTILKFLNASLNNEIRENGLVVNVNINIKTKVPQKKKQKLSMLDLVKIVNVLSEPNTKVNKDKDTIWNPDLYGLEDWQKELVEKGEYDPWDFEEPGSAEEMEEGDYYYDDPE